eukprot:m51a1_g7820 hypothetical protein (516) ;mRNA; f:132805-136230
MSHQQYRTRSQTVDQDRTAGVVNSKYKDRMSALRALNNHECKCKYTVRACVTENKPLIMYRWRHTDMGTGDLDSCVDDDDFFRWELTCIMNLKRPAVMIIFNTGDMADIIQAAIESGMPVTIVLGPLVSSYLMWHFGHGPTLYMLGTSASCAGFTAMYFLTEKMRNRSAVAPFLWSVQYLLTDAVMAPILQELESSCNALDQTFKKMEQALEMERAMINMYLRHLDTQKRDFMLKRPMYESDSEFQTEDKWIPEAASMPCALPIEWKLLHSIMVRAGMWKRNTPKALRARFLNYLNSKWKEAFQTEPRRFGNVWMYPETPAPGLAPSTFLGLCTPIHLLTLVSTHGEDSPHLPSYHHTAAIEIQSINDTLPMRVEYNFGLQEEFQYTSNVTEILISCTLYVKLAPLVASGGGTNPRYVNNILCAAIKKITWDYGGEGVQHLYGDEIHFTTLQETSDVELNRKYHDQAAGLSDDERAVRAQETQLMKLELPWWWTKPNTGHWHSHCMGHPLKIRIH